MWQKNVKIPFNFYKVTYGPLFQLYRERQLLIPLNLNIWSTVHSGIKMNYSHDGQYRLQLNDKEK